ncbi:MAG: phosphate signaling complex protein PhoU [Armatimonadota bacterium]|nr:phosphate signaling complex protein PhoU [bacterium]
MDTIRKSFADELQEMKQDILKMGSVVEEMLVGSVRALQLRDEMLADEIIAKDDLVDGYNLVIEQRCLRLLALQQPMARDLRTIAAGLYIIKDVERMGDYALDIAKAARKLVGIDPIKDLVKIPKMAQIVQGMLHDSLYAFVDHNVEVISEVARKDDEVDALYRQVRDELISLIQEKPAITQPAVELILVARYLERIADHITNVGERIAYMETGEVKELH